MTFRQTEFCRLILKLDNAPVAALRAGYSKSTAQTNAARLLADPAIFQYLELLRIEHYNTHARLTRNLHRLDQIIDTETDNRTLITAIHESSILTKQLLSLGLPPIFNKAALPELEIIENTNPNTPSSATSLSTENLDDDLPTTPLRQPKPEPLSVPPQLHLAKDTEVTEAPEPKEGNPNQPPVFNITYKSVGQSSLQKTPIISNQNPLQTHDQQ
jgi:hypothetical protein